ncbi:hypothetical protein sscle_04g032310 [Sclerotinia sclerotiorum 1980 UF-70]|uniref:Uncharacterized protein n=1 Tax=Sclerotinia sclerotiorum (strain ATCC 18683 / 1980 / Ss-1) TaxID=665079 RepID=A0A1D9Q0I5_SCLS1|nr:hypothetical protein sscle_04g032310 [Sclerotinia sclerotiorum 1980 UF-70]
MGQGKQYSYAAKIGREFCGSVYPANQLLDWIPECGEGHEQDKLVPRKTQAAVGQAYLMLPNGQALAPDSVWTQNEWSAPRAESR